MPSMVPGANTNLNPNCGNDPDRYCTVANLDNMFTHISLCGD